MTPDARIWLAIGAAIAAGILLSVLVGCSKPICDGDYSGHDVEHNADGTPKTGFDRFLAQRWEMIVGVACTGKVSQ